MLKFESKSGLGDYYVPENQLKFFVLSKLKGNDKYALRFMLHNAFPLTIIGTKQEVDDVVRKVSDQINSSNGVNKEIKIENAEVCSFKSLMIAKMRNKFNTYSDGFDF